MISQLEIVALSQKFKMRKEKELDVLILTCFAYVYTHLFSLDNTDLRFFSKTHEPVKTVLAFFLAFNPFFGSSA